MKINFADLPMKLIAKITGKSRYKPEKIVWSNKSWTHNIFRLYELIFGRKDGIRPEMTTTYHKNKRGKNFVVVRCHSLESVCALFETEVRALFSFKVIKVPIDIFVPVLNGPNFFKNNKEAPFLFAIAFDSESDGDIAGYTHTVSGTNTILLTGMATAPATSLTDISYNGSSYFANLINSQSFTGTFDDLSMYYKINPTTGSNTVAYTISGASFAWSCTMSYSGVDQATPIHPAGGNTAAGNSITTLTASVTTTIENCWIVGFGNYKVSDKTFQAGANTTIRGSYNTWNTCFDSNASRTAGSNSLTLNSSLASNYAMNITGLAPATGTTTTTTTTTTTSTTTTTAAPTTTTTTTTTTSTTTTTAASSVYNPTSFWNLDETSGTRNDAKSTNHLTSENSVGYVAGKISNAADLTGSTQSLSIADASQSGLDLTTELSISLWIKPSSLTGEHCYVAKWNDTTGQDSYRFIHNGTYGLVLQYSVGSSSDICISATALVSGDIGNWVHIGCTLNATTGIIKIYRNGALDTTSSVLTTKGTLNNNGFKFRLGGHNETMIHPAGASLDLVGVWPSVLSDADFATLYNSGNGLDPTSVTTTTTTTTSTTTTTAAPTTTTTTTTTTSTSTTTAAGSVSLTDLTQYRIYQRTSSNNKSITITGTYSGAVTSIDARIVQDGTSTEVVTWTQIDAAPAGGNFSGNIVVPQGGWYNVQVRDSNNHAAVSNGTNKFGIGILTAVVSQSNGVFWFIDPQGGTDLTANSLAKEVTAAGTWDTPLHNGAVAYCNKLATALNIPVGIIKGQDLYPSLTNVGSGYGYWLDLSGTPWTTLMSRVSGVGGELENILYIQGEADADQAVSEATFAAGLTTLFGRLRSNITCPNGILKIILAPLGRNEAVPPTDAGWQGVRNAQKSAIEADANAYLCSAAIDLTLQDGIHYDHPGYIIAGQRLAQGVLYALGIETYKQGPYVGSYTLIDSNNLDINVVHRAGTNITPTSGITGFEILNDGTPCTITSATRMSATQIRLITTESMTGTLVVRYLYGKNPPFSATVFDNTAMTLPLDFNPSISPSAATTTTTTTTTTTSTTTTTVAPTTTTTTTTTTSTTTTTELIIYSNMKINLRVK